MSEEVKAPEFITFADLNKVDIRVGHILAAEAVPKSELLKLQVDLGEPEPRQVLARIAKSYAPDLLLDRSAAFVVNLAPRMMKELMSSAMILAAPDVTGQAVVVFLPGFIKPGTRLG